MKLKKPKKPTRKLELELTYKEWMSIWYVLSEVKTSPLWEWHNVATFRKVFDAITGLTDKMYSEQGGD